MNLQQLTNVQPVYDELKLLNKKALIDDVMVEILGFILRDKELILYALEYDEVAWTAQREADEKPQSKYRKEPKINYGMPFHSVREIQIEEQTLMVSESSTGRLGSNDLESLLLVNEFVRGGFCASKETETVGFEGLMLTQLKIEGEFNSIPSINTMKKIKLMQSSTSKEFPVKKRLSLEIKKDYDCAFVCGKGENKIKFYVNKVYLMDIEELGQAKELFPKGMVLPVIEYETEEASLQMYLRDYVDTSSANSASAVGLIMSAGEKVGKHNLPLRAAALQSVPADTSIIEVEILSYSVLIKGKAIEI